MNEQPTTSRVALKWGAILGLASIVYSLVLFLTDNVGNTWLSLVTYALIIGCLILAMREFRTFNQGLMTYGQGLTVGTITSVVATLISSVFSYIYMTFLDPGLMGRIAEQTREKLEETGRFSDEQIDAQMEMLERFQSPGYTFVFGLVGGLLIGFVISLIVAAFLRKEKDNPFE